MIDQIIQITISPIFCLSLFTLIALCKEQVILFGQCKFKKIIVIDDYQWNKYQMPVKCTKSSKFM